MKLRTKLLFATTSTALLVLGVSEWLSYQETMKFLGAHLDEMSREGTGAASTTSLQQGMGSLAGSLLQIHLMHAAAEVLALAGVLTLFWGRLVLVPIRKILSQMNSLGHSVTAQPLRVDRQDEIGEMTSELNRLSGKLTTAMEHAATASELSALALLGQSMVRNVATARDQLAGALLAIAKASNDHSAPPDSAITSLEAVLDRLSSLPQVFEQEFEKRLRGHHRKPQKVTASALDIAG